MKILSFSYCFPDQQNPNWGMFVYQRLAALSQLETLQVCSPAPWFPIVKKMARNHGPQQWKEVTVHRPYFFYFPGFLKNADAYFYARGLKQWLQLFCQKWKPDLLDAHFIWPDGVGVALLAKSLGIPYAITLRGRIYECLKSASQTRQCTEALMGAVAVLSVSSRMAEEAIALGVTREKVHVISNGVDLEHFHPRDKRASRTQLGLPEEDKLVVTVAHLGHRKGHHEMIEALAGLAEDVKLVIVGGPAQGGTAEGLLAVARNCGVEDRLILPGPQAYELIPFYLSAADATVLASYREGCPNVVLESLACGTPVVATDVGAVPNILPSSAGHIVPVQQIEPLRNAVSDVLSKTWKAETVVQESGVRSWRQVAEEVQSVLKTALRGVP